MARCPPPPVLALGAVGSVPPGLGVVEGGEIPYKPEALAKKKENQDNWLERDPEIKCYLPGVPRATYMPQPFQILQSSSAIFIAYQYAGRGAQRLSEGSGPAPIDSWMGQSVGRWEGGDTLVDRRRPGFNDQSVVRPRRQLPQRGAARRRALHADRAGRHLLRSDDRGSADVHAAVEDQHAALPPASRRTRS